MVFLFFFMERMKKLPEKMGKSALMNDISEYLDELHLSYDTLFLHLSVT